MVSRKKSMTREKTSKHCKNLIFRRCPKLLPALMIYSTTEHQPHHLDMIHTHSLSQNIWDSFRHRMRGRKFGKIISLQKVLLHCVFKAFGNHLSTFRLNYLLLAKNMRAFYVCDTQDIEKGTFSKSQTFCHF